MSKPRIQLWADKLNILEQAKESAPVKDRPDIDKKIEELRQKIRAYYQSKGIRL